MKGRCKSLSWRHYFAEDLNVGHLNTLCFDDNECLLNSFLQFLLESRWRRRYGWSYWGRYGSPSLRVFNRHFECIEGVWVYTSICRFGQSLQEVRFVNSWRNQAGVCGPLAGKVTLDFVESRGNSINPVLSIISMTWNIRRTARRKSLRCRLAEL